MKSKIGREDSRDSPLKAWVRALEMTAPIAQNPAGTLPVLIDSLAERFGTAPALLSRNGNLTYRELAERSKRYAQWALRQGLSFGDVVCLLMPNCSEYVAIWLGLTRVGGIVSLLNTNLVGDSLAYAINIVASKHVIVGAALVEAFAAVAPKISPEIQSWAHGENSRGFSRIDDEIERSANIGLSGSEYRPPTIADRALYIYTSGTTGLPKAVNVSHFRLMQWSHWFAGMMDTRPDDRIYNCLPMYHSVGGVAAIGATLVNGGSVVLRERFSASRFWDDVVESNCTIFQYIGELCRYLVNTAPHPRETQHQLRLACGNGLGADVWERFQSRFHIPQILEFYAATEGNFSLYNCEGRVGAIGKIPSFLPQRSSIALVKFDLETGSRYATKTVSVSAARPTKPARPSDRSSTTEQVRPAGSKAMRTKQPPKRRSCATCSRPETRGFAPATSCAEMRAGSSTSSIGSAIRSAGRARMCQPPRLPRQSARIPAWSKRSFTE